MSVMGVSKEPVGKNGAQSLGGPPLFYSTDFLIISVFPQDICTYLFPQDTIISSQSWHVQATPPPPTRPVPCLSIVHDQPPGQCSFRTLVPLPALLPRESVLSSQPPAQLQDTPGWLPPGLWCITPSLCHFILTPGNPCLWWRSTQQPNLEFCVLFCSQEHIFLFSHTHNQTLSSPATALPLVSPHILSHNNHWWCKLCMVIHSFSWNRFRKAREEI